MMLLTGCAVSAALPDGLDTQPEPPISEAQSAPTPSPSPEPEVYRASVGIVGDILMMTSQIQGAKTAEGRGRQRVIPKGGPPRRHQPRMTPTPGSPTRPSMRRTSLRRI